MTREQVLKQAIELIEKGIEQGYDGDGRNELINKAFEIVLDWNIECTYSCDEIYMDEYEDHLILEDDTFYFNK